MSKQFYYTAFQEPWWLNATAPGHWDEVSVESGGEVVARLPYSMKTEGRILTLTQPPLTQTLGPWVKDTGAAYTKALGRTMSLYEELIGMLPAHDKFFQNFAPQVTNWLPFYWNGFSETTRYTYQIDLTETVENLLSNMDKRNRSQLRKAEGHLVANVENDLETFLKLNRSTFRRQGREVPYSDEFVYRLDQAVLENASRSIVICRDSTSGVPHAAIYMVHYGEITHSLMSGTDESLRDQNGMIVARWKAINVAREKTETLDLQGSMMRGIERRNRKYGAHQLPLMTVSRKGPSALRAERVSLARREAGRLVRGATSRLFRR